MLSRAKSDAGFLIVEVVISAALLLLVTVAVFATLDKSDSLAANQQRRTLAANLAQSEIERIRSIAVTDAARLGVADADGNTPTQTGKIPQLSGTQNITEDGIEYTIDTETRWGSEAGDELGYEAGGGVSGAVCNTPTGGLDFLRSTVKVTWKGMGSTLSTTKPIVMSSTLTTGPGARPGGAPASGTGSLMVHVYDRDGVNLSNVTVNINGLESLSGTTNSAGCILFPSVLADNNYTLSFNSGGKVDGDARTNPTDVISVGPGKMNKVEYQLDTPAYLTGAYFQWRDIVPNGRECVRWIIFCVEYRDLFRAQDRAGKAEYVALDAGQPRGPRIINVGTGTSWTGGTGPATQIFPFTGQYVAYAGTCRDNLPLELPEPALQMASFAANRGQSINLGTSGLNKPIRLAGLKAEIEVGGWFGSMSNGVIHVTYGCGQTYVRNFNNNGDLADADKGFPYGDEVDVCISARVSGLFGSADRRWQGLVSLNDLEKPTSLKVTFQSNPISQFFFDIVDGLLGLWDGAHDQGRCEEPAGED